MPIPLQNGWTNSPFGTRPAAFTNINGIVHLEGAIATTAGNAASPFTLPSAARPSATVWIPIDTCDAHKGHIQIGSDGAAAVADEAGYTQADCFSSMEGVSYAKGTANFTPLRLQHQWTSAPFGTRNAAARIINGIVHLEGAVSTTGSNAVPFTLPAAFRPAADVYVDADLCDATIGRLLIQPTGVVTVEAEAGLYSEAQCMTSLDGVTFAVNANNFTKLTLQNGWQTTPYGTANPAARVISGIVQLEGAISTSGTNPVAFTLPKAFRPSAPVYVPVDLCSTTNGRLVIQPTGVVAVEAEGGTFSNAACFTSLDGVSFAR